MAANIIDAFSENPDMSLEEFSTLFTTYEASDELLQTFTRHLQRKLKGKHGEFDFYLTQPIHQQVISEIQQWLDRLFIFIKHTKLEQLSDSHWEQISACHTEDDYPPLSLLKNLFQRSSLEVLASDLLNLQSYDYPDLQQSMHLSVEQSYYHFYYLNQVNALMEFLKHATLVQEHGKTLMLDHSELAKLTDLINTTTADEENWHQQSYLHLANLIKAKVELYAKRINEEPLNKDFFLSMIEDVQQLIATKVAIDQIRDGLVDFTQVNPKLLDGLCNKVVEALSKLNPTSSINTEDLAKISGNLKTMHEVLKLNNPQGLWEGKAVLSQESREIHQKIVTSLSTKFIIKLKTFQPLDFLNYRLAQERVNTLDSYYIDWLELSETLPADYLPQYDEFKEKFKKAYQDYKNQGNFNAFCDEFRAFKNMLEIAIKLEPTKTKLNAISSDTSLVGEMKTQLSLRVNKSIINACSDDISAIEDDIENLETIVLYLKQINTILDTLDKLKDKSNDYTKHQTELRHLSSKSNADVLEVKCLLEKVIRLQAIYCDDRQNAQTLLQEDPAFATFNEETLEKLFTLKRFIDDSKHNHSARTKLLNLRIRALLDDEVIAVRDIQENLPKIDEMHDLITAACNAGSLACDERTKQLQELQSKLTNCYEEVNHPKLSSELEEIRCAITTIAMIDAHRTTINKIQRMELSHLGEVLAPARLAKLNQLDRALRNDYKLADLLDHSAFDSLKKDYDALQQLDKLLNTSHQSLAEHATAKANLTSILLRHLHSQVDLYKKPDTTLKTIETYSEKIEQLLAIVRKESFAHVQSLYLQAEAELARDGFPHIDRITQRLQDEINSKIWSCYQQQKAEFYQLMQPYHKKWRKSDRQANLLAEIAHDYASAESKQQKQAALERGRDRAAENHTQHSLLNKLGIFVPIQRCTGPITHSRLERTFTKALTPK